LGVLDLRSSTIRFKTNIVLSAGAQPRIVSKDNLALLAWEVRSNNVTSLRATFFSELPATGLSSTELIRFRYPAQYSLAASEHGFLIYGREEKPLDYGNLPDGRTFAFYIERTRGSVLSNVVENASGFSSSISIEGGTSDFFVTYISPLHGMQTVTQWIMPTQSSFALTGPKVRQGRFVTGFSALVDRAYQVEVSDDLKDWHVVADLDGVGPYEISTERNTGHRFFRVTAAPE